MPKILQMFLHLQGCWLCERQQNIFLTIGVMGLLGFFLIQKKYSYEKICLFMKILMGLWFLLFCVGTYHTLIQEGFLETPAFCKAFDAHNISDFLQLPPPPCNKKTLVILGISAPIYNMICGLLFFFWGVFLLNKRKKEKVLEKPTRER